MYFDEDILIPGLMFINNFKNLTIKALIIIIADAMFYNIFLYFVYNRINKIKWNLLKIKLSSWW